MTPSGLKQDPRIIIAATCFADANQAIRVGATLAAIAKSTIHAMLVEDDAILRWAALPFAKALTRSDRASRAVTPEAMQQAFSRDARTFELALHKAAQSTRTQWTFERRRGRTLQLLREMVHAGDLVLVGHQRSEPRQGEIVLFDIATPPDGPQLVLGLQLAQRLGCPLRLFLPHASLDAARRGIADWRRIQTDPTTPQVTFADAEDHPGFMAHLDLARPSVVLISSTTELETDLSLIADTARCPVLVHIRPHQGGGPTAQ